MLRGERIQSAWKAGNNRSKKMLGSRKSFLEWPHDNVTWWYGFFCVTPPWCVLPWTIPNFRIIVQLRPPFVGAFPAMFDDRRMAILHRGISKSKRTGRAWSACGGDWCWLRWGSLALVATPIVSGQRLYNKADHIWWLCKGKHGAKWLISDWLVLQIWFIEIPMALWPMANNGQRPALARHRWSLRQSCGISFHPWRSV